MVLLQIAYRCEECEGLKGKSPCNHVAFYDEEWGCPTHKPKRCPYKGGFVKAKWKRVK